MTPRQRFFASGLALLGFGFSVAPAQALLMEDFNGPAGSQPAGFVAFTSTPGMVSQNDGASEYEQRRVSANGVAIANYQVLDEIDKGEWRDTTASVITRYSGASGNLNGLIVRARDIVDAASGDGYHVRMNGNNLEAFRFVNGAFTNLGSVAVAGGLGAVKDRVLEVTTANISDPDTDNVRLVARLYDGPTTASAVVATLNILDTSSSAITSGGGVGFRSNNSSGAATRATFDSLSVTSNNTDLLHYEDYSTNQTLRIQPVGVSGQVDNGKYEFDHAASGNVSYGLIDFDSFTSQPQWENVQVTALMRLNTNNTGGPQLSPGLVLRETGIASNVSTGPGDLYHYRLVHDEANNAYRAELLRKDGAAGFTFLETLNLTGAQVPESQNIFMSFSAYTLGDDVLLTGLASLNADFSNPFGVIEYTDSSLNAILGPGSAGFRVFGQGTANFDNFTVTTFVAPVPEPASALLGLFALSALGLRRRRA